MKAKALSSLIPVLILIAAMGSSPLESGPVPRSVAVPSDRAPSVTLIAQEPGAVVVHGAASDLRARLKSALDRFATAGLTLPPLDITFHNGRAGCGGHPGLFEVAEGVSDIEVCNPTNHIVLHELAHAWVARNVNQATKEALTQYWGLATWNDQEVDWGLRANERAADAIAFALGDLPKHPEPSLVEFLCSYSLVTGHAPPRPAIGCVGGVKHGD